MKRKRQLTPRKRRKTNVGFPTTWRAVRRRESGIGVRDALAYLYSFGVPRVTSLVTATNFTLYLRCISKQNFGITGKVMLRMVGDEAGRKVTSAIAHGAYQRVFPCVKLVEGDGLPLNFIEKIRHVSKLDLTSTPSILLFLSIFVFLSEENHL
jgi:hypothetical protein